jgi:hypothetical protein
MIGLPVAIEFPNDYKGVHKAFSRAKPVEPSTDLGKRFAELAQRLLAKDSAPPPPKRFVDYFTISPARFSFHEPVK